MTYWDKVSSRLSVPGLLLLAVGALLCFLAPRICAWLWKKRGDRAVMPVKVVGLVLALAGALILLDFFPGL